MSGYIYQFGLTEMPGAVGTWNVTANARRNTQRTLGGVYDPHGADIAPLELPYPIVVSAKAYEATAQQLGAALDSYRGLLGKRDRLWLKPFDTTQVDRWCWARCVSVPETNAYNNRITQPVELVFDALSPWYGHAYGGYATFDSGYYFDNGLFFDSSQRVATTNGTPIVTPNNGNYPVYNAGVTITPRMSISWVEVTIPSVAQLKWTGAMVALDSLIIDCGARTVLFNGAPAYSGFEVGANQYNAHWLPLEPGNNDVIVTVSSPHNSTYVTLTYSDTWA